MQGRAMRARAGAGDRQDSADEKRKPPLSTRRGALLVRGVGAWEVAGYWTEEASEQSRCLESANTAATLGPAGLDPAWLCGVGQLGARRSRSPEGVRETVFVDAPGVGVGSRRVRAPDVWNGQRVSPHLRHAFCTERPRDVSNPTKPTVKPTIRPTIAR